MAERKNRKKQPDVADLQKYREKRNFRKTREPSGGEQNPSPEPLFVVQKHASRRLHYDLRLETEGVLKSWAVPKGPSYDPAEKRLAVRVEDHPLEYADFEGLIPEKEYGAGTVMVWDRGTWTPTGDWRKSLQAGKLKFRLDGRKLKGTWTLVKIREPVDEEFGESRDNWLLIKHPDEQARPLNEFDVIDQEQLSVKTGRTMEEITAQRNAFWQGSREVTRPDISLRHPPPVPPAAGGAKTGKPGSFSPQLATLVSRLPEGDRWLSEIKFDGYRLLARIEKGTVVLTTRRDQNWTEKFSSIARELSRLPVEDAIIDGEVVVMNPDGTSNFQKLQNLLKSGNEKDLVYYAFDIPYYQGHDLTGLPLRERKALLQELLLQYGERMPAVRYTEHLEGSGEEVLRAACQYGVEGIIAKRADSPYVQKRTKYWVKRKCINRQEFVIGGFTAPKGTRSFFGALVLGYYNEAGSLVYCGNVGTGFNEETIKTVYEQLKNLEQTKSPFASPVDDPRNRDMRWVAPKLIAEVEFSGWTEGGSLRHPSFVGLREDKRPDEITIERETPPPREEPVLPAEKVETTPAVTIPIKLSNPGKILYPEQGLTKKDLAEYYVRIGHLMLPELTNRPLVLVRCPEGIGKECFYQKHLPDEKPEWISAVPVEEKGTTGLYPVVHDLNGLLALVQLGVLEIHMLGCRADDIDHPDRMIFDLDPAPEVMPGRLIEATHYIGDWLVRNKMRPFLKLTGGKGIHIVVPLSPVLNWEEVKKVSKAIALEMVRTKPDWFVATVTKRKRTGKILIDYLRNGLGASTIVPYSTRAKPGAPVAFPVTEQELTGELLLNPVTVRNAAERLKRMKQAPWEGMK